MAARRMSLALLFFGLVAWPVAFGIGSQGRGWRQPIVQLAALLIPCALALVTTANLRSPRWRAVTVPMAFAALPVAALWFRPIANVVAEKLTGAIEPLPLPELMRHPEFSQWFGPSYAGVCKIFVLLCPGLALLLSLVSRDNLGRFSRAFLVCLGVCMVWALEGFETSRPGPDSSTNLLVQRSMGRPTVLRWFDGNREYSRAVYSWRRPLDRGHYVDVCAEPPSETAVDWNGDGQWDVWTRRVATNDDPGCGLEYRVDTLGILGEPDWTFVLPMWDLDQADDMIAKARLHGVKQPSGRAR